LKLKILFINFKPEEAQDGLKYLEDNFDFPIDGGFCNLAEYEKKIVSGNPGLVFIDVDLIGSELHEMTRKIQSESIRVVWVAGRLDRAGEAFDMELDDFIVKPFRGERILKPILRLLRKEQTEMPDIISVWETDRFVVLKPEQIVYCYTTGRKTAIKTTDGEFSSMNTLVSLEHKLAKHCFFRTHKSFLVNQTYIKEIIPWFNHTYNLVMNYFEHDEVPVSRTYLKKFKQRMGID
jgi:DNA-binding LytR/AlgR family response regulator